MALEADEKLGLRSPAEQPPRTTDRIFTWLQKHLQREVPGHWGEVLDAGTGPDSLRWLASCPLSSITAVTAREGMQATTEDEVGKYLDPERDVLVIGNWADQDFFQGREFDVVVADYLLGSIDFFAPHFQLGLVRRLRELTRPGGLLLFIGREPDMPPRRGGLGDEVSRAATLVFDVEALRDAAMLLGRQRPYREMPKGWVMERLEELGMDVEIDRDFPRQLTTEKVLRQLDWANEEAQRVPHELMRVSLRKQILSLRARVEACSPLRRGFYMGSDYAIVARKS